MLLCEGEITDRAKILRMPDVDEPRVGASREDARATHVARVIKDNQTELRESLRLDAPQAILKILGPIVC